MGARLYRFKNDVIDDREFVFGDIWQIRDELIDIPNADRIINGRKYHFSRCVVIISNSEENFDKDSLPISVAPISSRTDCIRRYDVELTKDIDGVLEDSIVMLDYIQPVLKKDLYKCVGNVSNEKKIDIYESLSVKLGMNPTQEYVASGNSSRNVNV